jgi:hypothetical protein
MQALKSKNKAKKSVSITTNEKIETKAQHLSEFSEDGEEEDKFVVLDKRNRLIKWIHNFWTFICSLGGIAVLR